MRNSQLIAHRGLPQRFPENTLTSASAAVACGAKWLEIDVQLTADQTPILYHDHTADRVSGASLHVLETPLAELQRYGAYCPQQFGAKFRGLPISTLRQLVTQLNDWPDVRLFVEIKRHSVEHFGPDAVFQRVAADLAKLIDRRRIAAIISFDVPILAVFHQAGWPVGWVVRDWNDDSGRTADEMQPKFLFIKHSRVPVDDKLIWQGRWDWAVYPIDQIDQAVAWRDRGWPFVETNVIDELIDHPAWQPNRTQHDGALESM